MLAAADARSADRLFPSEKFDIAAEPELGSGVFGLEQQLGITETLFYEQIIVMHILAVHPDALDVQSRDLDPSAALVELPGVARSAEKLIALGSENHALGGEIMDVKGYHRKAVRVGGPEIRQLKIIDPAEEALEVGL